MRKPGLKGRFPRSLFLLLLLGAMAGGVDGCASYGGYSFSVGVSYGYPYRYRYPSYPYSYYRYYPYSSPSYGFGYTPWPYGYYGYYRPYWEFRWIPHHFHRRFHHH